MRQTDIKDQHEFRTAVTMTVVYVAGMTLIVIFTALFAGLWLDKILNIKPLFTIVFILASIPVTLFLTFRIVRTATARIQPSRKKEVIEEEPLRGEDC